MSCDYSCDLHCDPEVEVPAFLASPARPDLRWYLGEDGQECRCSGCDARFSDEAPLRIAGGGLLVCQYCESTAPYHAAAIAQRARTATGSASAAPVLTNAEVYVLLVAVEALTDEADTGGWSVNPYGGDSVRAQAMRAAWTAIVRGEVAGRVSLCRVLAEIVLAGPAGVADFRPGTRERAEAWGDEEAWDDEAGCAAVPGPGALMLPLPV